MNMIKIVRMVWSGLIVSNATYAMSAGAYETPLALLSRVAAEKEKNNVPVLTVAAQQSTGQAAITPHAPSIAIA